MHLPARANISTYSRSFSHCLLVRLYSSPMCRIDTPRACKKALSSGEFVGGYSIASSSAHTSPITRCSSARSSSASFPKLSSTTSGRTFRGKSAADSTMGSSTNSFLQESR